MIKEQETWYVYFAFEIIFPSDLKNPKLIKIGITQNTDKRLRNSTNNPGYYLIWHKIPFNSEREARNRESELQQKYKRYRHKKLNGSTSEFFRNKGKIHEYYKEITKNKKERQEVFSVLDDPDFFLLFDYNKLVYSCIQGDDILYLELMNRIKKTQKITLRKVLGIISIPVHKHCEQTDIHNLIYRQRRWLIPMFGSFDRRERSETGCIIHVLKEVIECVSEFMSFDWIIKGYLYEIMRIIYPDITFKCFEDNLSHISRGKTQLKNKTLLESIQHHCETGSYVPVEFRKENPNDSRSRVLEVRLWKQKGEVNVKQIGKKIAKGRHRNNDAEVNVYEIAKIENPNEEKPKQWMIFRNTAKDLRTEIEFVDNFLMAA